MFSSYTNAALIAASSLFAAVHAASTATVAIPSPTASVKPLAMEWKGCFSSSDGLTDYGPYTYQTTGNCQAICVMLQKPVMALVGGSNCLCGDYMPLKSDKIADSECDTACNGFNKDSCGGNKKYGVWRAGLDNNDVEFFDPAKASKTAGPGQTVVSTVVVQNQNQTGAKSGATAAQKAGIAAGVVIGIVALASIVGGTILFLRRRRRLEVEEEHRQAAAVKEFVTGGRPGTQGSSSITDSRLDPEAMRRQSVGSLADNQDYSRRILQVRNPDGY